MLSVQKPVSGIPPGESEEVLGTSHRGPHKHPRSPSKGPPKPGAGSSDLGEVSVQMGVPLQPQVGEKLLFAALQQLVEDVEIPLPLVLIDNSRLFYQVTDDMPAYGDALQNRTKKKKKKMRQRQPPGHSRIGVSRGTEILKLNEVGSINLL